MNEEQQSFKDGRFTVYENLGSGGTATVYRVRDNHMQIPRALKVLKILPKNGESLLKRQVREAEVNARFNHPNITRIYDIFREGDFVCTVMELGLGTVADSVRERGQFSVPLAIQTGIRVAAALEAVHKEGIIHRDVKPHNLILFSGGNVKLADFGIASNPHDSLELTKTGQPLGTVGFMAPEQLSGSRDAGPAADIYGLAGTLIWSLTLKTATDFNFERDDPEISLPKSVLSVLAKALSPKPEARYASMREFGAALEGLLKDLPPSRDTLESRCATAIAHELHTLPSVPTSDVATFSTNQLLTPVHSQVSSVPTTTQSRRVIWPYLVAALALGFAALKSIYTPDPVCGNGVIEVGESCDDGNTSDGDACSAQCTPVKIPATCGNGLIDEGEHCDDGNKSNDDYCQMDCTRNRSFLCGNGKLDSDEECDDGNHVDTDLCTNECKLALVRVGGASFSEPFYMGSSVAEIQSLWRELRTTDPDTGKRVKSKAEIYKGLHLIEVPKTPIALSPFYIMNHEVTQEAWRYFRQVSGYQFVKNKNELGLLERAEDDIFPRRPVKGVLLGEARTYCRWLGGDLPTEAHWELVASNRGRTVYPWGNEKPTCERAVLGREACAKNAEPKDVCSKPAGNTRDLGPICDMAGNVDELVLNVFPPKQEFEKHPFYRQDNPWLGQVMFKDFPGLLDGWQPIVHDLHNLQEKLRSKYFHLSIYPGSPSGDGGFAEAAWGVEGVGGKLELRHFLTNPNNKASLGHDFEVSIDDRIAIVRGGGFANSKSRMNRAKTRYFLSAFKRNGNTGFRCVMYKVKAAHLNDLFAELLRSPARNRDHPGVPIMVRDDLDLERNQ